MLECDLFIIGGGPSGAIAAAKLVQRGYSVVVAEKLEFPRFVIGESLLPACNQFLENASMLEPIDCAGFQFKGGVIFTHPDGREVPIHFDNNLGQKWGSSYQVKREQFDQLLIEDAIAKGATVHFKTEVIAYDENTNIITTKDENGTVQTYRAKKVLDASGYGRVLPKMLDLEERSTLEMRRAVFCRVDSDIRPSDETEGYIFVMVHGDNEAWLWNIPFSDGTTSYGVVCSEQYYQSFNMEPEAFLDHIVANHEKASTRYSKSKRINEVGTIGGFSAAVKTMVGKNWLLSGNASEFLDPVFSSGVTLALASGERAAELIMDEFEGRDVNYKEEYEEHMMRGINVFRAFVQSWYDGKLQEMIFSSLENEKIKQSIVSILSGYVWDEKNIFVKNPQNSIDLIVEQLRAQQS